MFLDLLISMNKKILDKMIEENVTYDKILKQSQKLDVYIAKKTKRMFKGN